MRPRALLGIAVVLALWGVLAPASAGAHTPRPLVTAPEPDSIAAEGPREREAATATPSPREPGPGWVVVAAALALAATAGLGGRRAAAVAVVAAVVVFAHESGVHAVHHLGDEAGATACEVATAASSITVITDTSPVWIAPATPVTAASVEGSARRPAALPRGGIQVRAPPRSS
jgi:hypothetical protein